MGRINVTSRIFEGSLASNYLCRIQQLCCFCNSEVMRVAVQNILDMSECLNIYRHVAGEKFSSTHC